ncbi:hypothetical protein C2E23DRAFT_170085 [Lenzites betulinus]|nr:hypothetical protein C2E23DRAFT_170085 [Lenzites betulinus]
MALRVLSGIKVPVVGSKVILAIKKCAANIHTVLVETSGELEDSPYAAAGADATKQARGPHRDVHKRRPNSSSFPCETICLRGQLMSALQLRWKALNECI